MSAARSYRFAKLRECPSSFDLLSNQRTAPLFWIPRGIDSHVAECDFCSLESILLALHYPEPYKYQPEKMPPHLHALAAAVLGRKQVDLGEVLGY
jgi:hypothetical protein